MGTRIITTQDGLKVDRWDAPSVDATAAAALSGAAAGHAHLLTARQLDELQRQVQEEAQQRGFAQGLSDARAEVEQRVGQLEALLQALAQPFQELDARVERELAAVAVALASHLVRRELDQDPELLLAAVRDCMRALPTGSRELTLYVNPADAQLIREALPADSARPWRLEDDPALARGDLRVTSRGSQVDGRLETRLRELVAAALDISTTPVQDS